MRGEAVRDAGQAVDDESCGGGVAGEVRVNVRDAGGSHVSVVTMGAGLTTVDQHIDAIRQWREAL